MLSALISAVGSSVGLLIDKIILTRRRVELNVYLPILFVFLFIFTAAFTPLLGRVNWELALLPNSLFLLLLMVVIAIVSNVLAYQSIQREKVHQHELIMMTVPLLTILLAAVFFPEELDGRVFAFAIVASICLIFAKGESEHFKLDQTSYNLILAAILLAIESIISRELLFVYSPVALYAVRTFFIAAFFWGYYRPQYQRVSPTNRHLIAVSALIGVVQMVTKFYAFNQLGLVYTALVLVLSPMIVFFLSWEFLHEKIRARVVVCSIIILICVTWATVLKF